MSKENAITIFEQKKVRTHWDEEKELWFISVIDVIEVLTGTDRPRKYWNDLKTRLKKEGSELSEKIGQLKMQNSQVKKCSTCRDLRLFPKKRIFPIRRKIHRSNINL